MHLFDKVKGIMNIRAEVIKQMSYNPDTICTLEEQVIATYVLAVCTREITIDTLDVNAYTYTER